MFNPTEVVLFLMIQKELCHEIFYYYSVFHQNTSFNPLGHTIKPFSNIQPIFAKKFETTLGQESGNHVGYRDRKSVSIVSLKNVLIWE
jgi:hypothetical protein